MSTDTAVSLAATSLTFSILSFIIIVVGLLFLVFPGWLETIKSTVANFSGSSSGFFDHLKVLSVLSGTLTPDIVLLIGFVSDLMNFKFRYSATSLIAILAVIINWAVSKASGGFTLPSFTLPSFSSPSPVSTPTSSSSSPQLLGVGSSSTALVAGKKKGGVQLPAGLSDNFNPCTIRGLEMFDAQGSPMGIVALAAVFVIYFLDMRGGKRTSSQIFGFLVFTVIVFANTIYSYIQFGNCLQDTSSLFGILKSIGFPLGIGLAVGGIGFTILKSKFVNLLPLDGTAVDAGGSKLSGGCSAGGATCSEPNDDDQMVCEAYQDGKRITSVSLQK